MCQCHRVTCIWYWSQYSPYSQFISIALCDIYEWVRLKMIRIFLKCNIDGVLKETKCTDGSGKSHSSSPLNGEYHLKKLLASFRENRASTSLLFWICMIGFKYKMTRAISFTHLFLAHCDKLIFSSLWNEIDKSLLFAAVQCIFMWWKIYRTQMWQP